MTQNDDGTLAPLCQPHYRSKAIAPGLWQSESVCDHTYLIEGCDESTGDRHRFRRGQDPGTSSETHKEACPR